MYKNKYLINLLLFFNKLIQLMCLIIFKNLFIKYIKIFINMFIYIFGIINFISLVLFNNYI